MGRAATLSKRHNQSEDVWRQLAGADYFESLAVGAMKEEHKRSLFQRPSQSLRPEGHCDMYLDVNGPAPVHVVPLR